MASTRETILARVATVLAGTVSVGPRIYRSRFDPLARAEAPAIIIEPIREAAKVNVLSRMEWQLTFRVTVFARGAIPDQVADPILVDAHNRIMADPTLDGMAVDVVPSEIIYEMDAADQPSGYISIHYMVQYRTAQNALT